MSFLLVSGPAVEPVTLADAKVHLRLAHNDDDATISALISAARLHVEAETRRALIDQDWRLTLDAWPRDGIVKLRPTPLRAVAAVTLYGADGTPTVLDAASYLVDLASAPARLKLRSGAGASLRALNGIEIDFTAGYGATPDTVPVPLIEAILMLIAHWYEHREAVAENGAFAVLPTGVEALIAPYRVLTL